MKLPTLSFYDPIRGEYSRHKMQVFLARNLPTWTRADHKAAAAKHEKTANRMSTEWGRVAEAAAMETWGRPYRFTDYKISGIASNEFSDAWKDKLRKLAHDATKHKHAAVAHEAAARMTSIPKGNPHKLGRLTVSAGGLAFGAVLENKLHPEWGTFRVSGKGAGGYVITGERGSRVLDPAELGEWQVKNPMRGKPSAFLHNAWDVYLRGKLIDTVFDSETDAAEVKRSLVNHDGYDSEIEVRHSRARKRRAVVNGAIRMPWAPTPEGRAGDVRGEPAGNPRKAYDLAKLYRKWVGDGPVDIERMYQSIRREKRAAESGAIQVSRGLLAEMRSELAFVGGARRAQAHLKSIGNPRRLPTLPGVRDVGDDAAARELQLYVDNDADLYRQQHQPIQKNLITKMARGTYDREKAVKLFMYLAESGAKKYTKEFGGVWNQMFDVPTRRLAATWWRDVFEEQASDGSFDSYLPKKYQKPVPGRRAANDNPKRKAKREQWWAFGVGSKLAIGRGTRTKALLSAKKLAEIHGVKVGMSGPYATQELARGRS